MYPNKNTLVHIKNNLTLIFLLLTQNILAQEYNFYEKITSEGGLSQSIITCIIQDKEDIIWIGSQNGLNRYDTYHFTSYLNNPSDSTSLSDNYILSLCEDLNGNLWVGTMSGGLNKLDKQTDSFSLYSYKQTDTTGLSNNTIWSIAVDQNNHLWCGSKKGVNELDIANNIFTHYRYAASDTNTIPSDMATHLFVDKNNNIWCGTHKGIAKYNKEKDYFERYKIPQDNKDISSIWGIAQNIDGKIIFGNNSGLWEQKMSKQNSFELIYDTHNTIWSILPIENTNWLGTHTGLLIYKDKTCSIKPYLFSDKTLNKTNFWSLLKDKSGIIWAGTDEGILKFKSQKGKFKSIHADRHQSLHLSNKNVSSILLDSDSTLWVGTNGGGLNYLPKGEKQFYNFTVKDAQNHSLLNQKIWALLQDSEGIIWIGTYGNGLYSYDKTNTQLCKYPVESGNPMALSNSRVLALLEDHQGDIWIGTRGGGLNRYNKHSGEFEVFKVIAEEDTSISSNTILSLAEDDQGNLLIGTFEGGMCIYDRFKKQFIQYKNSPTHPFSIAHNNVWAIFIDQQKRLWLGTQAGLDLVLNSQKPYRFYHFTTQQGLASNTIFGIKGDHNGNIWLSTFKGITKLENKILQKLIQENTLSEYTNNPFNKLFKNYDQHDGIAGIEFNQGASYKAKDGTIFFGGFSGLTYFKPDNIIENQYNPRIILTGFKIFNKSVTILPINYSKAHKEGDVIQINGQYFLSKKIKYLKHIQLTYHESVFSFEFSSLDYTQTNKNHFAYKMENFDQNWRYVEGQNTATYTNLDAGTYIFRVRGTNSDNHWSSKEVKLYITISPPFWKTWWFITLFVTLLVIIIVSVVVAIINKQKEKERKEKEKIALQLKTIKNQIDPHFAFNAMNMIGALVYKGEPDTVYDYFSRFANLIRKVLQDSEKIARPLEEEIEFVKNYIEIQQVRFKNKIEFFLRIEPNTNLKMEVPKMIIQTFAENAIKHGLMHKEGKGKINIEIKPNNNGLLIAIEDDGIGRQKASKLNPKSTGKGFQIINEIFTLYNKLSKDRIIKKIIDLKDDNGNATGTRVEILIIKNKMK